MYNFKLTRIGQIDLCIQISKKLKKNHKILFYNGNLCSLYNLEKKLIQTYVQHLSKRTTLSDTK